MSVDYYNHSLVVGHSHRHRYIHVGRFHCAGNLFPLIIQSLLSLWFCSVTYVTIISNKMVVDWILRVKPFPQSVFPSQCVYSLFDNVSFSLKTTFLTICLHYTDEITALGLRDLEYGSLPQVYSVPTVTDSPA